LKKRKRSLIGIDRADKKGGISRCIMFYLFFSDSMQAMGFDNDLYLKLQSERIKERIQKF